MTQYSPLNASRPIDPSNRLHRRDFFRLVLFCLALFGYAMFSGRPLTLHEARLPETSREMLAGHDWLIPRSGGRPWLERPPLPHWITIATSVVLGQHCDSVWVVRLPSAVMGTIIVLLTAWIAGRFFGRWIGIASALLLATGYEFHQYATLAEDDIYLAALVAFALACFVKAEFFSPPLTREKWWGGRPWPVVAFFIITGLTNLVKGPLVGAVIIGSIVGPYLLLCAWLEHEWRPLKRYLWPWGILLFIVFTLLWPIEIARQFPEVLKNWSFDYADTRQYDEPFWYYIPTLLWTIAPWTPLAIVGLWQIWIRKPRGPWLFTLVWAIVPILVLSIPHRKHHHYLVPCLMPWAIVSAVGAAYLVPLLYKGANIWRCASQVGLIAIALLAIGYCAGATLIAGKSDKTLGDTAFLKKVNHIVSPGQPLLINASSRSQKNGIELDFFRIQFYLRPEARLLHNLTYLRCPDLHARTVYLITRANDEPRLQTLGQVQNLLESTQTRGETTPSDRFILFRLTLRPDLPTYPCTQPISTLQAMGRAKGPYCGPPFADDSPTTEPAN